MNKCVVKVIKKNGSQRFGVTKSKKILFHEIMFPYVCGNSYFCIDKRIFIINFKNDI